MHNVKGVPRWVLPSARTRRRR